MQHSHDEIRAEQRERYFLVASLWLAFILILGLMLAVGVSASPGGCGGG